MGAMRRDATATRQRILTEAIAEFARYGIAGARVDRIAAAARCNKAMIYAYFTSKDELFNAVFAAVVIRNVDDVPIDVDDLPGYAASLSDQYRRYPEVGRIAAWDRLERGGEGIRNPTIVAANRDKVEAVRQAQAAGRIANHYPPEVLLEVLFAIAAASFDGVAPDTEPPDPDQRRQLIRDTISRLIKP